MRMIIIWPDIQKSCLGQFSVSETLSSDIPDGNETEKLPFLGMGPLHKKLKRLAILSSIAHSHN